MSVSRFTNVEDAVDYVDHYQGSAEDLELGVSEVLLDPVGLNMAIITDRILAKGFMPDGYEQGDGFRIYRYKVME